MENRVNREIREIREPRKLPGEGSGLFAWLAYFAVKKVLLREDLGAVCSVSDYLCTCSLARRVWPDLPDHQLDTVAAHIGHEFHHHHAQSDAEAAGRVLLAMMKYVGAKTPSELLQKAGMVPKRFCKQGYT